MNDLGTRNDDGRGGGGKIKGRALKSRFRFLVGNKNNVKNGSLELHFFSSQKINTSNTNRVVVAAAPGEG